MPDTHEYLVNTKFPEFSLYDDEEKLVSRADIEGKWTVIFFYPKDDSPGCTLQSCSFRDQYEQFTKKGVLLYGSPQTQHLHIEILRKDITYNIHC